MSTLMYARTYSLHLWMCLPLSVSEEAWERRWRRKVWQWSTYCSIDISGLSILCLVHRMRSFPFFSEWHRIQLLNVLWLLKGSWIFQVNNLREELQSLAVRPVTVVTSATKSGQCLFTVSVNESTVSGYCVWLESSNFHRLKLMPHSSCMYESKASTQ